MKITFRGCDFDVGNPEFRDGYAVVTRVLSEEECRMVKYFKDDEFELKGIIDENGNSILTPEGWYAEILQFAEKNFAIKERFRRDGDGEQGSFIYYKNAQFKICDGKLEKIAALGCIRKYCGEKIINKENDKIFIYDILTQKASSEKFDKISNFNEETGLAEAVRNIDNKNFIVCFLNGEGKITTDVYSTATESVVKKEHITNFEEFVEEQTNLAKQKEELRKFVVEELQKTKS